MIVLVEKEGKGILTVGTEGEGPEATQNFLGKARCSVRLQGARESDEG